MQLKLKDLSPLRNFLLVVGVAILSLCLHHVFYKLPNDYLQGIYVKIMYIHVPSAWLSMFAFVAMATFSGLFYYYQSAQYDIIAKSIAPAGATLSFLTLVTGSIWGKPTWGTWWVWDARLTSMLLLFIMFAIYISIRKSRAPEQKIANISAIFAIIGVVNIPIIKFSVDVWSTLHQKSSFLNFSGITIHPTFLAPLLVTAFALLLIFTSFVIMQIQTEMFKRKLNSIRIKKANVQRAYNVLA